MTRSLARNDRKRDVEDAVPYGVQQSYGDVGTPSPTTVHRTRPQGGRCPHIAPSDKCAFCGGTHGSRPTGYAGHAGRDVGTPSPTTAHRTRPQEAMPTHRPAGQMRILRRDTWVPPYRVRRSCRTGRRDAVPYNGSPHPSAGGRCPHIAPPDKCAFCGGTHGSRPTGYADHAGRDGGTPSPTTVHRARPQGGRCPHIAPPAA